MIERPKHAYLIIVVFICKNNQGNVNFVIITNQKSILLFLTKFETEVDFHMIYPLPFRDMYLGSDVLRQSTCELEVDVVAADILNRQEVDGSCSNVFQIGGRGGDTTVNS